MSNSSPLFKKRHSYPPAETSSCCTCSTRSKVSPEPGSYPGFDIVAVKPKRMIRVRHINAVLEEPTLQKETTKVTQINQPNSQLSTKGLHEEQLINIGKSNGSRSRSPNILSTTDSATVTGIDVSVNENGTAASKGNPKSPRIIHDTPLFFIHGVGGSSDVWQLQLNYFESEGYEMIVPDMIGHGLSSAPRNETDYHFKEISSDFLTVFDIYCKKQNVIVGHSYGASFAAVICRSRPSRVRQLIMLSGGSPTPLAPQPGLFKLPECILGCCQPFIKRGFNKSAFKDATKSIVPSGQAFDVPTNVLKHTMNGQDWPEGDNEYHSWIVCPTLLIHGECDALVSLEEEQEMEEALENCRLEIISNCSHMVMMEDPAKVNALIHDFISSHITTPGSPQRNPSRPSRQKSSDKNKRTMSMASMKSIPSNLLLSL